MARKEFKGQFPDEKVLFVFKKHPIVMRKGLMILMFALLGGALVGMFMSRNVVTMNDFFVSFLAPIGYGLILGGVGLFYYWIGWNYSVCIVTDQRFIQLTQQGVFKSRSVNDISLSRILSVNYEIHGMVETLLGFGTIIIQTLVGDFLLTKVSHPAETQSKIVMAIKESGVDLDEEAQTIS